MSRIDPLTTLAQYLTTRVDRWRTLMTSDNVGDMLRAEHFFAMRRAFGVVGDPNEDEARQDIVRTLARCNDDTGRNVK